MQEHDKLINSLIRVIHFVVKALAVLMTLVIIWGALDVCWILYKRLSQPPLFILDMSDLFVVFGGFLAVLIAIEIFINITVYLQKDVFHVKIVLATALMAIARKVIVFDFKDLNPPYLYGTAAVVLALSVAYWLVSKDEREDRENQMLGLHHNKEDEDNDNAETL